MRYNVTYSFFVSLFIGILIPSCVKKPVYPSTPVIAYQDFIRYGKSFLTPDSAELVISFTDNEGDIGLTQKDTFGINKLGNLWMIYYYLDTLSGKFVPYDLIKSTPEIDTLKISYRVPVVLREQDKSEPVKGLIYAKLKQPSMAYHNKVMYKVYLFDLAGHYSNRIDTPVFDFVP